VSEPRLMTDEEIRAWMDWAQVSLPIDEDLLIWTLDGARACGCSFNVLDAITAGRGHCFEIVES
jgi:hypothetical protein